jgi:hypothetical protein
MRKGVVTYIDGEPCKLSEVKDFKDDSSYLAYEELCKRNEAKKFLKEAEETKTKLLLEEEAKKEDNKRIAWLCYLYLETELDKGTTSLTEEEYSAYKDNFNLGDIKDLGTMPKPFIILYDMLKR